MADYSCYCSLLLLPLLLLLLLLLISLQSNDIHVAGLIVSNYSAEHSHWNSCRSLGEWLKSRNIPALYGIDTRCLTKIIRDHGSLLGKIEISGAVSTNYIVDVYIRFHCAA
jgi:carbamoylphosphate synthase small subunit